MSSPPNLKKVYIHQMSGDIKEEVMLDEDKNVAGLFDDIRTQSPSLKAKMDAATGAMLLLYNGQQLASSSPNAAKENKSLKDMACWPREPDTEHIPILHLYVPKHYTDVDKTAGTADSTAKPAKKGCCVIL